MANYTWVITPYNLVTENSSPILKVGPSGSKNRLRMDLVIKSGEQFRMLNGNGKAIFTGHIFGEYTGHEPLTEYGLANGCQQIQYYRRKEWKTLSY